VGYRSEGESDPYEFLADTVAGDYAALSPDGRYVAYSSRESSQRLLVLTPHLSGDRDWVIHVALDWQAELERTLRPAREALGQIDLPDAPVADALEHPWR